MSVVKVIEIIAKSTDGWEDAAQKAVTEAAKSVRNISSVYIKDMQANVSGDKLTEYKVTAKISFLVEG